ncbi:hypothetical protein COCOBI_14-4560 [Coccomyxa sp. Obi]|nr:hypothetical protein COCOBI_14-4560 [Coccomyxa sp. Obi]
MSCLSKVKYQGRFRNSEDDEADPCALPSSEDAALDVSRMATSDFGESTGRFRRAWDEFEGGCSGFFAASIINSVESGDMRCALTTMRAFSHAHITHCVARITEAIVLDKDRPDIAAAVMMQLMEDGEADVAADMASAPVKRGRLAALFRVFDRLMAEGEVAAVADLLLEVIRRGDAPVVADLLTAAVWVGEVGYARDAVAVLIARGCPVCRHGAEMAEAMGWMIRVGEAFAVAEIAAALVDGGGLALVSDPPIAAAVLGGTPPDKFPCVELIRLGRVDAVAHICGQLAYKECWGILYSCFEALARSGNHGASSAIMQFLAIKQRPDIIATIVAGLVDRDQIGLAAACMAALLDGQQPWAAATVEAYMVSSGHVRAAATMEAALSDAGYEPLLLQASMLLIRGGHTQEWAAVAQELLRSGRFAMVADRVAGLASIIGPVLTASALAVLARRDTSEAAALILLELCASGREAVAADLLAALANGRRSMPVARDTVILLVRQGHADTVAALLVRITTNGQADAVLRINQAVRAAGRQVI